ncbi:MAG: hypothetical protein ABSG53_02950 [Thermoguttaceae bacterium]
MGVQKSLSTLQRQGQVISEPVGGLTVDDAKVEHLPNLALLVGHVGFGGP